MSSLLVVIQMQRKSPIYEWLSKWFLVLLSCLLDIFNKSMRATKCSVSMPLRRGHIGGSLNSGTIQLQNGSPEDYFYGKSNFFFAIVRGVLQCYSDLNSSTLSYMLQLHCGGLMTGHFLQFWIPLFNLNSSFNTLSWTVLPSI